MKKIEGGGCLLVGDKNTIVLPGMRPTSPRLLNDWTELRREIPPKTIPRAAIKGEIEKPGSDFDYAVPLTETVILGTIAMRSAQTGRIQTRKHEFQRCVARRLHQRTGAGGLGVRGNAVTLTSPII